MAVRRRLSRTEMREIALDLAVWVADDEALGWTWDVACEAVSRLMDAAGITTEDAERERSLRAARKFMASAGR